jgi:hypothetical protein
MVESYLEMINKVQSTKMRGAEWPRGLISLRFQEHALTPHLCILYPKQQYIYVEIAQKLFPQPINFSVW